MTLAEARILIVDDEPALRNLFAKWLIRAGCPHVRTAENGREAIDRINEDEVDVLITDVRMPVMDGVMLVQTLCDKKLGLPCIIFATGAIDIDYRKMYGCGVEAFLGKPFHMEELEEVLRRAIADRAGLWSVPMTSSPSSFINSADHAGHLATDIPLTSRVDFHLGRGGFSLRVQNAPGSGKVSFDLQIAEEPGSIKAAPRLCGQGFVRWRSRSEQRVGIELAYLESPGREWIVDQIKLQNPVCFIPA